MSDRTALTLGERLEVEAALEVAFAPLREQRTDLSALRARAAVRWGRGGTRAPSGTPAALRWSGAISRLSELSVAVGMSVMVFAAANGPALEPVRTLPEDRTAVPAQVRVVSAAEEKEIRALRLEWIESLTSRLDGFRLERHVPFQDWLDPTVVRPASGLRLNLPAPRSDATATRAPY